MVYGEVLINVPEALPVALLCWGPSSCAQDRAGVYPVARRYVPRDAWYATLLMSTGLTFGTIPSLYGLNAGIIDQAQFSVLVTVVVLTAILPTILAQRWFTPPEAIGARGRGGPDA